MPTIGAFHTKYWEFSDTNAAPIHVGVTGYPLWQASVVVPSLFGIIGAWIDARVALVKWHWRLARRVHQLAPESKGVLLRALTALEDPRYPAARAAVRATATTLGFNRPEAWKPLSQHMKAEPGRAENVFRHLNACRLLRETAGSTLTNPEQNLLTELAYHGFVLNPKGKI